MSGRVAGALQARVRALQRGVHGGVLLPALDRQPPGAAAGASCRQSQEVAIAIAICKVHVKWQCIAT